LLLAVLTWGKAW